MKEGKKIEKIESKESTPAEEFLDWVVETAEKSDNYVEFYKQAQHKYIDSFMEGKNVDAGGLITQFTIWGEAFKLAAKDNPPLRNFIDGIYKESVDLRKKKIELDIPDYADLEEEEEEEYEKLKKELEKKSDEATRETIESYKEKTGNYKVLKQLKEYEDTLTPMGYGNGELAAKMTELRSKKGFSLENQINYGFMFQLQMGKIIVSIQGEKRFQEKKTRKEMEELFD